MNRLPNAGAADGQGERAHQENGTVVRRCHTIEEFDACVDLQRAIWGEADVELVPNTVFVVAEHTGGQAIGAFDDGKLIGFTLAMPGLRNGAGYLHSHMTGVESTYRDRGVGRMLKLFQREEALSRGIRLIEWTFDPLEMRNAHFNLNRLGAIARRYLPNLYGITTSPLHRGLATDRLVAEWQLDSARVLNAIGGGAVEPLPGDSLFLPAELENWKNEDLPRVQELQAHLRDRFRQAFAKGYAALAVGRVEGGATYQLGRVSDL